jgi:hypothetical protein
VKRPLPTAAALLSALALTVSPAIAQAESAGGQQYSDPLAAIHKTATKKTTKSTSTAPSATKAPPVSLSTTTTSTPSTTGTSNAGSSELPRTGLNEGLLVAIAAVLLLVGLGLRLRTAGVRRR